MSARPDTYRTFLEAKVALAPAGGFEVSPDEINPLLLPHQRAIVIWACRGGRRAIFAAFGLGKSIIQIELVRIIVARFGGRGLIVMPLGVRQEFIRDARVLATGEHPRITDAQRAELRLWQACGAGRVPEPRFIRSIAEADATGLYLANYETVRDGKLDPRHFTAATLDEASCLRGFGGSKTFRAFMRLFDGIRFKFVATATPSPNEFIELLAYSAFLEIMDVGQAKTRFFRRNSEKADSLTIHPHKQREFWLWVASWGLFVQKPSDLGFSDAGYDLPEMAVNWHELPSDHSSAGMEKSGQGRLLRNAAASLVDAAREKRDSIPARIEKMLALRAEDPAAHRLIWHDLEAERHAIEAAIPGIAAVWGSQDLDEREQTVIDFSDGKIPELAAKPVIAGSGCNFQRHCHWAIFLGIGFKFNDFVQAIHRIQRFLQTETVRIDLIHTEAERPVRDNLMAKWRRHEEEMAIMTGIIREYGLSAAAMAETLTRAMGVERIEVSGDGYRLINNDCVVECAAMPDASVDLIVTSIPFSTQYEYSPNYCFDEQTEVLTRRGFLRFGEIVETDDLATINPDTLAVEWQQPQRIVWQRYTGPMLHFVNRGGFDQMVTPDHRLVVDTRVGNRLTGRREKVYRKVLASEIAADFVPRKWRMLNAAAPGTGDLPDAIAIPPIDEPARGPRPRLIDRIAVTDFAELAGWYLSEGYCDDLDGGHAGRISIGQLAVNEPYRQEIIALFERIGIPARAEERNIVAHSRRLATFLIGEFGQGSKALRIPRWVKDWHPSLLAVLRDTMMKGDGNKDGFVYTSFSPGLRDDFQEICFLTGWRASIAGARVNIGRKQLWSEIRRPPERVAYDGMMGCATVRNGTLVVRRNGVVSASGNCDFGHTDDNAHFWAQMDFLIPQLLRVLAPGRVAAIHVKDRIVPGGMTGLGFQTVYPFSDDCIAHFRKAGFAFLARKSITTDVVRENNQTYRLGWSEQCKDGSRMGNGLPEYLLIFRRPPSDASNGYADLPVMKEKRRWSAEDAAWTGDGYSRARWQLDAHGYTRSSGDRQLTPQDLAGLEAHQIFKLWKRYGLDAVYDFEHHVRIAEHLEERGLLPSTFMLLPPHSGDDSVWTDITRMLSMNTLQAAAGKEMHLCPLQFDIVDRAIAQYSMPGETVLDPFGGLMTVPYRALKLARRGVAVELNPAYFLDGCKYVEAAAREMAMPSLFDLLDGGAAAERADSEAAA